MRTITAFVLLLFTASTVCAAPYLSVVFEYTVGPDTSRHNLRVVSVEDPQTRRQLSNALTKAELQRGVAIVAKRKAPSRKEIGQKLYEVDLFDLATRRYYEER